MRDFVKITMLLFIVVFYSCNNSKQKSDLNRNSSELVNLFDSKDNIAYIGFVNKYYFQNSDEFYIELYPKSKDFDFEKISKLTDSLIYKDDENMRRRIPLDVAAKSFDFSGLKTLVLYDEKHNKLTSANFVRVELLDGNISSFMTAIYKTNKSDVLDKAVYCIGNLKEKLTKTLYSETYDSLKTDEIANKLKFKYSYNLDGKHYWDSFGQMGFSVVNLDSTAHIIESSGSQYNCVYKSNASEYICELMFIPLVRKSRPVILTKSGYPDTDIEWNSLLVYDGTKYKIARNQRLNH